MIKAQDGEANANAYNQWLAAEIEEAIDDPLPSIPHDVVMARRNTKIADALAMPGIAGIEFDPPRVTIETRLADFSEDG